MPVVTSHGLFGVVLSHIAVLSIVSIVSILVLSSQWHLSGRFERRCREPSWRQRSLFFPLKGLATKTALMNTLMSILPEAHGTDFEDPVALHKIVDSESLRALPDAAFQSTTAGSGKKSLISREMLDPVTTNFAKCRKASRVDSPCPEGHFITFYAASNTTGLFPYGS